MTKSSSSSSAREALADAAAGVAGSLVAMLAFYPVDVMKTNLQASSSPSSSPSSSNDNKNGNKDQTQMLQQKQNVLTIAFLKSIFRGLHYKTAHTIVSSFTYFFIYSFVQTQHKRFAQRRTGTTVSTKSGSKSESIAATQSTSTSTSMRLFLSAFAGMVNVMLTFPLDVLAARSQTKEVAESKKTMDDGKITSVTTGSNHLDHHGRCRGNEEQKEGEEEEKEEADMKINIIMDQVWNELNNSNAKDNNHKKDKTESRGNLNENNDECSGYDTTDDDLSYRYSQNDDGLSFDDDDDDNNKNKSDKCLIRDGDNEKEDGDYTANTNYNEKEEEKEKEEKANKCINQKHDKSSTVNDNDNTRPMFRLYSLYKPFPSVILNVLYNLDDDNDDDGCTNEDQMNYQQKTIKKGSLRLSMLPSSSTLPKLSSSIHNFFDLWRGIQPALLLCSNPAINFTVFDILKDYVLLYKQSLIRMNDKDRKSKNTPAVRIHMMEAFIIGLIAKFAATIATYPLIRAKIMLMVAKKTKKKRRGYIGQKVRTQDHRCQQQNPQDNDDGDKEKDESLSDNSNVMDGGSDENFNMMAILYSIYAKEGIRGLYKGCGLQLIHTMLKSALLMMVRERITVTTKRLIIG